MRYFQLTVAALLVAAMLGPPISSAEIERPRLLVLTDIGGDPDDQQSLIRLLVTSNEFDIEGLIATSAGTLGELKDHVVKPELIRELVDAYDKVHANLLLHDPNFPSAETLRARIKAGNPQRGLKHVGEGHDTEGSNWIIQVADAPDVRPLCVTIWGGQTDFAQALWRVRHDRGESAARAFIARLRVFDINDQDKIQHWMFENFPDLFYLLSSAPPGRDKREGAYRGMYLGGDELTTSRRWLDRHVRRDHGPLGALYPARTWTDPNPHGALKEGDTPSWFYFRPLAVQDAAHPEWGGFGGRFRHESRGLWRDVGDTIDGKLDPRASVWRWRPIYQNEFQARMDWCVKPVSQVNHPPRIQVAGIDVGPPIKKRARAGQPFSLALQGADRDGEKLSYCWMQYVEAGTYPKPIRLQNDRTSTLTADVPADAAGKSIHLILEATDTGNPPLTALARVVLYCE